MKPTFLNNVVTFLKNVGTSIKMEKIYCPIFYKMLTKICLANFLKMLTRKNIDNTSEKY
jgi:hypothetical protein